MSYRADFQTSTLSQSVLAAAEDLQAAPQSEQNVTTLQTCVLRGVLKPVLFTHSVPQFLFWQCLLWRSEWQARGASSAWVSKQTGGHSPSTLRKRQPKGKISKQKNETEQNLTVRLERLDGLHSRMWQWSGGKDSKSDVTDCTHCIPAPRRLTHSRPAWTTKWDCLKKRNKTYSYPLPLSEINGQSCNWYA